jgi:hypothetical protein
VSPEHAGWTRIVKKLGTCGGAFGGLLGALLGQAGLTQMVIMRAKQRHTGTYIHALPHSHIHVTYTLCHILSLNISFAPSLSLSLSLYLSLAAPTLALTQARGGCDRLLRLSRWLEDTI